MQEQRILTGVKPTGNPHLGNLYGAILPAIEMANNSPVPSYIFIANIRINTYFVCNIIQTR